MKSIIYLVLIILFAFSFSAKGQIIKGQIKANDVVVLLTNVVFSAIGMLDKKVYDDIVKGINIVDVLLEKSV